MKINRRPSFAALRVLLLLACFSTGPAFAEFRAFTSKQGKTIRAEIISATSEKVTLRLEDGRETTGGVSFFSEADQKFIAKWREKNPVQIDYDFNVDVSRDRTDRDKQSEGSIIAIYETWQYKINLENRSRNGADGVTAEGLQLHYNIIKSPNSDADQARYLDQKLNRAGRFLVKTGSIDLGMLEYLRGKEFITEQIPINNSELAPGWYYPDGSKDEKEDTLEGITIKIMKDGKAVFEKTVGSKDAEAAKWVPPRGGKKK